MLSIGTFVIGQNHISKVKYTCITQLDKGSQHNGFNTLYFNNEAGLFIHNDYPTKDKYTDEGTTVAYVKGDDEGLPVFINLKERYIKYKEDYTSNPKNIFIIEEDIPDIKWTINSENKTIGNFTCIKAVGVFGGRTYEAWFTPQIPVSLGPYKLGGLPGMILEAKSQDGRVSYTFAAYESPTTDEVELSAPKNGRHITWDLFKEFIINRLLRTESASTSEVISTDHDPPANWTIEKSKFTIISEYKKQRKKNR